MSKKISPEDNIKRFKIIHGDKYEYPNLPGENKEKFVVFCNQHRW